MIMARASESIPLAASAKAEFTQLALSLKGQLEVADSMAGAGANAE
jgi:hypothetical protein